MQPQVTSEKETMRFAQQVALALKPGDVLALVGDLGAGKTHFVKGLARGLESEAAVSSPTFTLVHEYADGTCPLYHFDFYRVDHLEEIDAIGWDEYLDQSGIVVAEWADRFPELMPSNTQWWQIEIVSQNQRRIQRLEQAPPPTPSTSSAT
ncbi:MAG: tRNA (adenosine(37)-N6)-threonylcarbamoyltransferase complex ATPase subunit type 1 TsaE [Verrucomicrobiales bacterium]|nr:tRNA (adenosine(37)-N6)-threonylcarbamoyltransferase complex ATPase subunit type 1 TsaE [Verrucomicrobiales bacterium]